MGCATTEKSVVAQPNYSSEVYDEKNVAIDFSIFIIIYCVTDHFNGGSAIVWDFRIKLHCSIYCGILLCVIRNSDFNAN